MHEIDLIPNEYRTLQWLRRCVQRFILIFIVILIVTAIVYALLTFTLQHLHSGLTALQQEKAIISLQYEELNQLNSEKIELTRQHQLLNQLRGGTNAQSMFVGIDIALKQTELWFKSWEFNRAGTIVSSTKDTVNTGYFVVIPQGNTNSPPQTWQIHTHMAIRGEAKNHHTLSRFIKHLFQQEFIADVKVMRTGKRQYANIAVIEFDLIIVVNNKAGSV